MTADDFSAAYERIQSVTGTRTQVELAGLLGIRQSSISDAKRRGEIPAGWLVTLLRLRNVNPEWILTSGGSQYLTGTGELPVDVLRVNWRALGLEVERILTQARAEIVGAMKDSTHAWELP